MSVKLIAWWSKEISRGMYSFHLKEGTLNALFLLPSGTSINFVKYLELC